MFKTLGSVLGRVFMHPVTKETYGPMRLSSHKSQFSTLDGKSFDPLAEDPCGNCFIAADDGAVLFWDHETDDRIRLAGSLAEFVANCIDTPPVELDPAQIKSVWIDPKFAKSIGKKVPKDGWVKKPY